MFYYQFNIGDYASHTRHLSIYEDIAYRRLLDWYYLNEKPIPKRPQDAARLIGMKDRYQDVEGVLEEFFTLSDEGWTNKRADKEIAVYKGFSDAGKRGAAKRWAKGGDRPPISPPIANNNQEPITSKQEQSKTISSAYTDEFEFAWSIYPKRPGANKKETYKAWNARIKAGASVDAMIDGAKRYAAFCQAQNTEPQYIKQAATFFGPSEHYLSDWKPPDQKRPQSSKDAQLDIADQIFRRGKYADDGQARGFAIGDSVASRREGIPEVLDGVWESSIEQVERDEYD